MCKTQRDEYEKYWDDISPFIKYGCVRDVKFADKMMDYMLFKDLDDKYLTLKEYVEKNKLAAEEKSEEEKTGDENAAETAEEPAAETADEAA